MYRLSIRMILFILVLCALHISAIEPRKAPATRLPQEEPTRALVQSLPNLSSHRAIGPLVD